MNPSRFIIGIVFCIGGLALIMLAFFTSFIVGIYGIIIFVLGIVIFFNNKEDRIEQRKDLNKKKNKR